MSAGQAGPPAMRLERVSRDYRQGGETVHALRSTDLELRRGELVGILGPSGSGKSTLLTIMGGLRSPSTGTVTISGEPFSALPERRRADLRLRRIGFVLQTSGLLEPLRADLDDLLAHLKAAAQRGPLRGGSVGAVNKVMEAGNRGVSRLPGKHGGHL